MNPKVLQNSHNHENPPAYSRSRSENSTIIRAALPRPRGRFLQPSTVDPIVLVLTVDVHLAGFDQQLRFCSRSQPAPPWHLLAGPGRVSPRPPPFVFASSLVRSPAMLLHPLDRLADVQAPRPVDGVKRTQCCAPRPKTGCSSCRGSLVAASGWSGTSLPAQTLRQRSRATPAGPAPTSPDTLTPSPAV